jgi:hypothetical protein
MKYFLCRRNEYGDNAIINHSEDPISLLKEARKLANEDNMENALTMDEKMKEWESVVVELFDDKEEQVKDSFYSGKTSIYHTVTKVGSEVEETKLNDSGFKLKFLLGYDIRSEKEIYALTPKGELITDINNYYLQGKNFYYIKTSR